MLPSAGERGDSPGGADVAETSDKMARDEPDRSTVDCVDLLVPEFCEIAGGSMREHRLSPLLDAMRSRGLDVSGSVGDDGQPNSLAWYTDLRRWGCPPHGGFGLGFDRLLCYLTGVQAIRDIVAFPRWNDHCNKKNTPQGGATAGASPAANGCHLFLRATVTCCAR